MSGLRTSSQFPVLRQNVNAKDEKLKSQKLLSIHITARVTMGFLRGNNFGLPLFCAAGNRERRLLAPSFASATRSGMEGKLPRLGAGTTDIRHAYTGILQPWIRNRLSASSPTPRLGCNSFFSCSRQPGADHDLLRLRVSSRSDRTWEIDVRSGERGLAQRAPGSSCAETRNLLSPDLSRPAERGSRLTVYE
jgi:hypothetical protein